MKKKVNKACFVVSGFYIAMIKLITKIKFETNLKQFGMPESLRNSLKQQLFIYTVSPIGLQSDLITLLPPVTQ